EATDEATGENPEEDCGSTGNAANETPAEAEEDKSESAAAGSEKAKDADPRPAGPEFPPQTFMAVYAGPAYFNGENDRLGFMSVGGFAPAPFKISEFCPDCGAGAREGDRFCRSCGRKLGK
ncbi:MAG: zinc ribbon domain-containing protein, partial [Clostridia bacterium]|nr:zinc ribbon domain-containing protein [Clostridia bacterium]